MDDLVVIAETEDDLIKRLNEQKDNMEKIYILNMSWKPAVLNECLPDTFYFLFYTGTIYTGSVNAVSVATEIITNSNM